MSRIRANTITNQNANGAPNFPDGITVSGVVTATTLNQAPTSMVVGSAVTANSTGIDVTGIVTATNVSVAQSVTATTYYGSGANLTGIDATALKDGSGNVIVQASASAVSVTAGKHLNPASTNSTDLGTTSLRWRNLYTQDLQLSNEGKTNDVDGTWGNYTIQEGESDLFLINNRSGKKYKFNLTEVS